MADSIRVLIVCEGQTEGSFVKTCLSPILAMHGVQVSPSLLKTRPGKQGGGNVTLSRLGRHLANEYPNFDYLTTLVDLYGFRDRQGRNRAELEDAIRNEARRQRPEIRPERVIPYVQQYEFEALLFSNVQGFEWVLDGWSEEAQRQLQAIVDNHEDPEQINDNPSTAPRIFFPQTVAGSKRRRVTNVVVSSAIGIRE